MAEVETEVKKSKFNLKKLLRVKTLVIAGVLVLALGGAGFLYTKNQNLKKENARLANPQEAAKEETERLKQDVGALIELPANESPTVATVVDASKLKEQAFFANAQNGDRVLMFPQAKKAILYRPSTKKIIEVAPINIGNNTSTQKAQ